MLIRKATSEDLLSVNDIYNSAVAMGYTAHTSPITPAERLLWFNSHDRSSHPILVAEIDQQITGWLSLSAYRPGRQALKYTAEISYYIAEAHRNKGMGTMLVQEGINAAYTCGFKNLLAIILENNTGSIRIIEKAGFKKWGFLPDVSDFNGMLCGHFYYGLKIFHLT